MKACIVVPHYDHLEQFRRFVPRLASAGLPLVVVDDASPPAVVDELESLLESVDVSTTLVRHGENQGKGGAVATGLRTALDSGFTHALQVDADGQHDSESIGDFLEVARRHPDTLVCGEPLFDASQSRVRHYARYITLGLARVETLGTDIRDALCGFRVYPLGPVVGILDRARLGHRMAFDPELLVRSVWAGLRLTYIPVRVVYPEGGRSHFHYLRDNAEISWMHTRLLVGMLLRLPLLLARKFGEAGKA